MTDLARCRYCNKEMPDFGEANGLNYAHTKCSLANNKDKADCFKGVVVRL